MKTLSINKMNEIERYGKRIASYNVVSINNISNWDQPTTKQCCYHYKGLFHMFVKESGIPIKYRTTKKW